MGGGATALPPVGGRAAARSQGWAGACARLVASRRASPPGRCTGRAAAASLSIAGRASSRPPSQPSSVATIRQCCHPPAGHHHQRRPLLQPAPDDERRPGLHRHHRCAGGGEGGPSPAQPRGALQASRGRHGAATRQGWDTPARLSSAPAAHQAQACPTPATRRWCGPRAARGTAGSPAPTAPRPRSASSPGAAASRGSPRWRIPAWQSGARQHAAAPAAGLPRPLPCRQRLRPPSPSRSANTVNVWGNGYNCSANLYGGLPVCFSWSVLPRAVPRTLRVWRPGLSCQRARRPAPR